MSETNWYVITGAPASGKTTLLKSLEELGYRVVHEVARAVIEGDLASGRSLGEIKREVASFERRILDVKVATEATLPRDQVIIFDRGIPDSIAYFKIAGLDHEYAVYGSPRDHYRKVFLLDMLQL